MKCRFLILFFSFFLNSICLFAQSVPAEVEFATLLSKSEISLLKGDIQDAVSCLQACLKINSNSSVANFQLARIYNEVHDFDASFHYAHKAFELKPDNKFYSEFLSELYYIKRDGQNFIKYKKLSFSNTTTYETYDDYLGLLFALSASDFFHEKLSTLNQMETLFGYDLHIGALRASLYEQKRDLDNAEVEYIRLSRTDSLDLIHLFNLRNFYERNGKSAKSQEVQKLISSKNSKNVSGYLDDNLTYLTSGQMDFFYENLIESLRNDDSYSLSEKIHHLNQILQRPVKFNFDKISEAFKVLCETYNTAVSPYMNYSSFLMMNNEFEKTADVLKSALEIDKSNFEIWRRLFKVLAVAEDYQDLQSATTEAMEYFPEMSEVYLYHGVSNLYSGKPAEASEDLDIAQDFGIDLTNSYPNYLFYLAVLQYQKGDPKSAENFKRFENFHLDDYFLQLQYAFFVIDSGKNMRLAESIINHYADDYNLNYYFYFVRAYYHARNNNLEQSREDIMTAINMDSSKYHVFNLAGDIYSLSGDCTNAIIYWNQSIDRGGNSTVITKKIQNCKK